MTNQMFTIQAKVKPTLAEAAAALGVSLEDLDASFGVVTVDPHRGLHTVLVQGEVSEERPDSVQRPFSDPRIEPANVQADPIDQDVKQRASDEASS